MAVRPVLKMGDPRLLERSKEVERFGTREMEELLLDMHDTMAALPDDVLAGLSSALTMLEARIGEVAATSSSATGEEAAQAGR